MKVKEPLERAVLRFVSPECHPERSMKSRQYRNALRMLLFGISYEVEVLHNVVKRSDAKPPQAGSAMGYLNVCLAFVTFFVYRAAYFQMLLCASRRDINRSEIPSSSVLCTNSSGFGSARGKFCRSLSKTSTTQKSQPRAFSAHFSPVILERSEGSWRKMLARG